MYITLTVVTSWSLARFLRNLVFLTQIDDQSDFKNVTAHLRKAKNCLFVRQPWCGDFGSESTGIPFTDTSHKWTVSRDSGVSPPEPQSGESFSGNAVNIRFRLCSHLPPIVRLQMGPHPSRTLVRSPHNAQNRHYEVKRLTFLAARPPLIWDEKGHPVK